jgi:membrane-associated protein
MGDMPTRIFALYNAIGAIAWSSILILSGYWLGGVPWVADHMSWLTVIIIVVSLLPVAVELVRGRK